MVNSACAVPDADDIARESRLALLRKSNVLARGRAVRPLTPKQQARADAIQKQEDSEREEQRRVYQKRMEKARTDFPGYVYVLTNPAFPGYVKIGRTTDPKHRLAAYNCGCPNGSYAMPVLIHVAHSAFVETGAHQTLTAYRASGEWFKTGVHEARQAILKANVAPRAHLFDMSERAAVYEPTDVARWCRDTEAEEIMRHSAPQDPLLTWADIEAECMAA